MSSSLPKFHEMMKKLTPRAKGLYLLVKQSVMARDPLRKPYASLRNLAHVLYTLMVVFVVLSCRL